MNLMWQQVPFAQAPFSPWTHDSSNNSVDPLNLVFDEAISLQEVNKAFSNAGKGWRDRDRIPGFSQWLHIGDQMKKRDKDWYKIQAGLSGLYRYHVRLWNVEGVGVVGSTHFETYPIHFRSKYFEGAEKEVAINLKGVNALKVQFDHIYLGNYLRDPNNNGYATFFHEDII